MPVSRSGEAFDDGGDDTDDIDAPPGLEASIVEESIANGLPELISSSSEDTRCERLPVSSMPYAVLVED